MRTRRCAQGFADGRLRKAIEFIEDAESIVALDGGANSAASLFVDAGIAASDVLCCRAMGVHAQGPDHNGAVQLLGKVDRSLAGDLRVLLRNKSRISYSDRPLPAGEFERVTRASVRLVEAARTA